MVRPCGHRMTQDLRAEWTAHLCGLCLALRGERGQFARVATNYDGLVISALTDAQTGDAAAHRRTAGPCPLRGMRTASVATGEGARLAATVSLLLASAKIHDHADDRNGVLRRRPVAAAARRVATGWGRAGTRGGRGLGFDTAVVLDAVERQPALERLAGPGTPLTTVTEPTETATAAAFAHTAHLAQRPANAAPLAEAGRLFGRLAHLLDAVEDRASDAAEGAWNPLTATGTTTAEARRLADDAVHGVRLALRDVEFADRALVHVLLVHELRRAVDRAFGTCSHPAPTGPTGNGGTGHGGTYALNSPQGTGSTGSRAARPANGGNGTGGPRGSDGPGMTGRGPGDAEPHALNSPQETGSTGSRAARPANGGNGTGGPRGSDGPGMTGRGPGDAEPHALNSPQETGSTGSRAARPANGGNGPEGPGGTGGSGGSGGSDVPGGTGEPGGPGAGGPHFRYTPKKPRGLLAGCAVAVGLFCTCRVCCADEFEGPWSRKQREGWCRNNCDCGCDCCDCCGDSGKGGCCDCCDCDCGCS